MVKCNYSKSTTALIYGKVFFAEYSKKGQKNRTCFALAQQVCIFCIRSNKRKVVACADKCETTGNKMPQTKKCRNVS